MLSDGSLESDENFDDFAHTYQSCLDTSCKLEKPLYSKRNRSNNPWITDAIIQSIKTKDELYDDWNKTRSKVNPGGDANLYLNYSSYRFKLKHIIKAAQKNFYGSKFLECKGDSKKTWPIINELRGKSRKSTKPQFIINNERIIERRVIANAFNKYFTSLASKLNNQTCELGLPITNVSSFKEFMPKSNMNSIFLDDCTYIEVEKII